MQAPTYKTSEECPRGSTQSGVLTFVLIDGREVSGDSEEWRFECEAREVLSWPIARRKRYLYGYTDDKGRFHKGIKGRGEDYLEKLENLIQRLWIDKQAKQLNGMDELTRAARIRYLEGQNGTNMRRAIEQRMAELNAAQANLF